MTVRLALVYLSELGHFVPEGAGEDESSFASYFVFKDKLSARKQANGYVPVI
jgi:hypothetical protein